MGDNNALVGNGHPEGGGGYFLVTQQRTVLFCVRVGCAVYVLYLYKPYHISTDRPASLVSFLWQVKLADSVGTMVLSGTKSLMVHLQSGNGTVVWYCLVLKVWWYICSPAMVR